MSIRYRYKTEVTLVLEDKDDKDFLQKLISSDEFDKFISLAIQMYRKYGAFQVKEDDRFTDIVQVLSGQSSKIGTLSSEIDEIKNMLLNSRVEKISSEKISSEKISSEKLESESVKEVDSGEVDEFADLLDNIEIDDKEADSALEGIDMNEAIKISKKLDGENI